MNASPTPYPGAGRDSAEEGKEKSQEEGREEGREERRGEGREKAAGTGAEGGGGKAVPEGRSRAGVATTRPKGVLYVIVCAAGAAVGVGGLIAMAQAEGWTVQIVATPAALDFVDVPELERRTGRPVKSRYRRPDEPRPPRADAIIVAPATYNTVNKFAQGIADTYALGLLAEAPGLGIPVVVVPFVNDGLASRVPFRRSVETLRGENVCVLFGAGESEPRAAGTGDGHPDAYPWRAALDEIESRVTAAGG